MKTKLAISILGLSALAAGCGTGTSPIAISAQTVGSHSDEDSAGLYVESKWVGVELGSDVTFNSDYNTQHGTTHSVRLSDLQLTIFNDGTGFLSVNGEVTGYDGFDSLFSHSIYLQDGFQTFSFTLHRNSGGSVLCLIQYQIVLSGSTPTIYVQAGESMNDDHLQAIVLDAEPDLSNGDAE